MRISEEIKQDFVLLGLHIKKLREERELTIKDVFLKTGISIKYLQKIEKGLAYGVKLDKHLLKIAIAFKTNFSEIFNYK